MKLSDTPRSEIGTNKTDRQALSLLIWLAVVLLIPNALLAVTEHRQIWSALAGILIPAGIYVSFCALWRTTGIAVLLMLPLTALCAFQIVLLYLYGNSAIAADMFINLMTTNPDEAYELLNNLYPAVIIVCLIYAPLLIAAIFQICRRRRLSLRTRRITACIGLVSLAAGCLLLIPAYSGRSGAILSEEVFPANVACNFRYAVRSNRATADYERTSRDFSFGAVRNSADDCRQIYVYIIGEASRAANWQLYGYERPTNRLLGSRTDLCIFRNVITQSNTTHKSVPMFLSPVATDRHPDLYKCKGLATLFAEAGFRTYFISNQSPQGAMVDKFAHEADEAIYIGGPRQDMQLLKMMHRIITADDGRDLFFILHCYGSHFSYRHRYPRDFADFIPDDDTAIKLRNAVTIRNAYDNSIVYTDYFLNNVIEYLDGTGTCAALLYCSDHGEDLFDDRRGRFLHASPTVTYYQLHVPCFAWFSRPYAERNPRKVESAFGHRRSAATTRSMFHTIADMASIESPYIDCRVSFVSDRFDDEAPRLYLDDHCRAVPLDRKAGINGHDRRMFRRHGIDPGLAPHLR